jgi:hypothetical protein
LPTLYIPPDLDLVNTGGGAAKPMSKALATTFVIVALTASFLAFSKVWVQSTPAVDTAIVSKA